MLTQEQLSIRKTGIGASETAAIMGFSTWKTAAEVFAEKTGQLSDDETSEAAHFGNVLEEVVAQEYALRMNVKVRRNNKTLRHKKHAFMLCHLDRVVEGEKRIVECKTASAYLADKWGDEFTDQVPEAYLIQVQHQMAITGYPVADIPVLIGGNQLKIYTINRNEELIKLVTQSVVNFWQNHVQKNSAPPLDYQHNSSESLIKKLYPGTDGSEIDITSLANWHTVLSESKAKIKHYEAIAQGAKNHIADALGSASTGHIQGVGTYSRKLIKRKGFTVDASDYMKLAFKKQH